MSAFQNEGNLSRYFLSGLNTIAFLSWNIGTWLGLFFANSLPEIIKMSMGIALYSMFIGLLVPQIKKSRPVLMVSFLAIVINSIIYWSTMFLGLSNGWGIIIATVVSAALGASFCSDKEESA